MTNSITLREVTASDLPIFFEHQSDSEANRMAAFPARDKDAFTAHWEKILHDKACVIRAIVFAGSVAGNIVSWGQSGDRKVGYWIGKTYWGQGIASAALALFLGHENMRPLKAHVAKHNAASIRVLQKCGFTISGEEPYHDADGSQGAELTLTLGANRRGEGQVP
jgi:RimJ/RimL family protein N-acetyltransferase